MVLAADVGQDFNLAMISAAGAYAKGYRVSVVDVAAAGSEKLKMIAEKGGGAYVSVVPDCRGCRPGWRKTAAGS